jgi:hypothetical protein
MMNWQRLREYSCALPWFFKGLNPPELAGMFAGMRAGMPPPVFQGILGMARGLLPTEKYDVLARDLACSPVSTTS